MNSRIAGRFSKRPAVIMVGMAACIGLAIGGNVVLAGFSAGSATIIIRGVPADPDTFSFTTLQDPADRAVVEAARQQAFDECMAAKGFPSPPDDEDGEYAAEYGWAAAGDDASSTTPPPTQVVEIAPGISADISVTWTPESCMYQATAQLGSDPLVREALRQRMTELLVQADGAAEEHLGGLASLWGGCLGQDEVDAQDLLNTIDGVTGEHSPYGDAAAVCLTSDMIADAMRIRAEQHIRVAAENDSIVQAWVKLVDTELAAAS